MRITKQTYMMCIYDVYLCVSLWIEIKPAALCGTFTASLHPAHRPQPPQPSHRSGTVGRSMLTVLQVATLDGWSDLIARPMSRDRGFGSFRVLFFAGIDGRICTGDWVGGWGGVEDLW